MSRFFIERPIFANVIAIITMIIGGVAAYNLPIEQYPDITPPTVVVTAVYPGANANVLVDTVAAPIEQQVNGVEDMLYMSSTCAADGTYKLTVTFAVGTDLDLAQIRVQNRVSYAMPKLPEEVQRQGVITKKQSTSIILVVTLTSPSGKLSNLFLSNYATQSVRDPLSRLKGVGDINVFGSGDYGMRVWIDPIKLQARNLTPADVYNAIREQNVQVAAGQVGQPPSDPKQAFQLTVTALGRLKDVSQFQDIIVKQEMDQAKGAARLTRIKDVARVELGAQVYDIWCDTGGLPAAGIAVFQLPGANALDVAHNVRAEMKRLEKSFPEGLVYSIPFNTTDFVEESIHEVYKTLFEAGVLVLIVILVFLQDWRAVLVPATTVPVTIIGAFAAMAALGFTVNTLTLFGLVLAIGIVVDDAIVIVENAAHHIDSDGLDAKNATIKAMGEVLGPIIGITLVLMAVFIPTAFLPGITGQLYRQFALTIAATALISAINAVTLKPAQCATYLRPTSAKKNWFYRGFNSVYDYFEGMYTRCVKVLVRWPAMVMTVFVVLVGITFWWFSKLPTGFLPTEDQGYAIMGLQLPDSASQARTRVVTEKAKAILKKTPGVKTWVMIGGNSLLDAATASNAATFYVTYQPWEERSKEGNTQEKILGSIMGQLRSIEDAMTFIFPPPAIRGLGTSGGFQIQLQDRGGVDLMELQTLTREMIQDGNGQSGLTGLTSTFRAAVPQLYADVDRTKVKSLNVPLTSVFNTLQSALGSAYVNDFNINGRTYQVRIQAEQAYRMRPEDIGRLKTRDLSGKMIPLSTVVQVRESVGPQIINRYNLYPSAAITGQAAPGFSTGEALRLMEEMAESKSPGNVGYEWTGIAYQEKAVGNQALYVFGLAVLLVYLVLAAQYESWTLPAAVIMLVPLALLGTVMAVAIRGMDNNIYTQIGIVLIIALASKNAILIVEFARELRAKGRTIVEAAVESARLRFRPILMTSFAFILGIVPLINATGAGAASRRALGTAVFGGMIASTVLAVFFVPVFYVLVQKLSEFRLRRPPTKTAKEQIESRGHEIATNGHGAAEHPHELQVPTT